MSNPPEKPKFISNLTWLQKTLAGISGTMFLMALITLFPWITTAFFKGFEYQLSVIRASLAGCSFIIGAWVGIPQIKYYVGWLFDFLEFYNKFKELKKKGNLKEDE